MPPVTTLDNYWKDDFRPLQDSAHALTEALKKDEASADADLYRRLASGNDNTMLPQQPRSSMEPIPQPHAYHYEGKHPKTTALTLKHKASRPLPDILQQALRQVQRTTFMGVLPALSWGYLTVDHTIYVFSFDLDSEGNPKVLLSFNNPRNQSILAAQIVKPRKGTLHIVMLSNSSAMS